MFRRKIPREPFTFVGGPNDGMQQETWGTREIKYFDLEGEKLRQIGVYRRRLWSKTYYWAGWIYI